MKLLIVDTFYGPYLQRLYADGRLGTKPWNEQHSAHFAGGFGTGDAYSHELGLLGVPAIEIVANSVPLQQAWAHEHQPDLLQLKSGGQQLLAILEAQIRWWQPTVLYVQDINWLPAQFLSHVKQLVQLVVGQNACPLAPNLDLNSYDLLLTSLPHYVRRFREQGVPSAYFPIGFDRRLIERHQSEGPRPHTLTFVGGLGGYHSKGTKMLEAIAQELPVQIWGYGGQQLPITSTLRQRWQGEAWADDMYEVLAKSQITINRHIDIAEKYANNMRLYEATGMGACLLTDHKDNIAELFEPGSEVVTYENHNDAIEKIRWLLANPSKCREIGFKGQRRTLREHCYNHRMKSLIALLDKQLYNSAGAKHNALAQLKSISNGLLELDQQHNNISVMESKTRLCRDDDSRDINNVATLPSRMLNVGGGHMANCHGWSSLDLVTGQIFDETYRMPYQEDTFDLVYTSMLLEHLTDSVGTNILLESRRVLRSHGVLRIVVPDFLVYIKKYFLGNYSFLREQIGIYTECWDRMNVAITAETLLAACISSIENRNIGVARGCGGISLGAEIPTTLFPAHRYLSDYYCGPPPQIADSEGIRRMLEVSIRFDYRLFLDWIFEAAISSELVQNLGVNTCRKNYWDENKLTSVFKKNLVSASICPSSYNMGSGHGLPPQVEIPSHRQIGSYFDIVFQ